MSSKEVMIDIYDDDRNFTGRVLPRKTKLKKGEYMMYVLAILERKDDGKMLITQRAMDKKWAAGAWEIPGGGVDSGEDSYTAVQREVLEETGLDVSKCSDRQKKPVYSYKNEDLESGDNYFMDIYHFVFPFEEKDVTIEQSESIDHKFASLDEIKELNDNSQFLHFKRLMTALENE